MRTIKLDLNKMTSLPALHNYLHKALELPEYYGRIVFGLNRTLQYQQDPDLAAALAQLQDLGKEYPWLKEEHHDNS